VDMAQKLVAQKSFKDKLPKQNRKRMGAGGKLGYVANMAALGINDKRFSWNGSVLVQRSRKRRPPGIPMPSAVGFAYAGG